MKNMIRMALCLVLAASLVLSGCVTINTSNNTSAAEEETKEEAKDLLDEILERGYINVGTEGTYAPNTYHDENDQLVGFDVEVAALVAKYLGVEVHYVEMEWSSIFAALDAGQIDTVVNEVGYTDERAAKYDFSEPYAFVQGGILVREDYDEINSFEDLAGKIAANESTSTWGALAQEYGAELDPVNAMAQSISEVLNGRADCTLNYITAFADYMKQQPDAAVKIAVTSDPEPSSYIPVRKGETRLVEAINEALQKALESGELKEVSEKYFGVDVTEKQ